MSDEKFLFAREAHVVYEKRSIAEGIRMKGSRVACSDDASKHLRHAIERHGEPLVERFVVLALDTRQNVLGWQTVGVGTVSTCPVSVTEVLRFPLLIGAAAIIVGHNHPSGDPHPSPEDIALTTRIIEASRILGIQVLDHVIIGEGHFSFLDAGLLLALKNPRKD